jgi:hypothetical protein
LIFTVLLTGQLISGDQAGKTSPGACQSIDVHMATTPSMDQSLLNIDEIVHSYIFLEGIFEYIEPSIRKGGHNRKWPIVRTLLSNCPSEHVSYQILGSTVVPGCVFVHGAISMTYRAVTINLIRDS